MTSPASVPATGERTIRAESQARGTARLDARRHAAIPVDQVEIPVPTGDPGSLAVRVEGEISDRIGELPGPSPSPCAHLKEVDEPRVRIRREPSRTGHSPREPRSGEGPHAAPRGMDADFEEAACG
jgi:hypothetical protein